MKSSIKLKIILLSIIIGAISGGITTYIISNFQKESNDNLIKNFYDTETAVHVSPHGLRKNITDLGDTKILVDLRSHEEYETEHIIGAISIPAYKTPDESAYSEVDRIVEAFKVLPEDKEIIVYCYSMPCMTGRKIGKMLSDNGIYVKQLEIGWQEWRYYWNLWNHDGETKVNPADYVISGSEPGEFKGLGGSTCPIGGDFGC